MFEQNSKIIVQTLFVYLVADDKSNKTELKRF